MSGPKGIGYEIALERRAVEAARRRWLELSGRAAAFATRCIAAGHPELAVPAGRAPAGTSTAVTAACDDLERQLAEARVTLAESVGAERTQELVTGLRSALDELERREQVEAARHTTAPLATAEPPHALPAEQRAARITQLLERLLEPAPELAAQGRAILAADHDRARLLLSDLSAQITAANRATERRLELQSDIAALRSLAGALIDPASVAALLDRAAAAIATDPGAAAVSLTAARALYDRLHAAQAGESDRRFVLDAVTESLQDLGYAVVDVELTTSDSLVIGRPESPTHAVRAVVTDADIDLRPVRLIPGDDRTADRNADEALCADLSAVTDGLRSRGITAVVRRDVPAGVVTPRLVARAAGRTGAKARTARARATRERTAD